MKIFFTSKFCYVLFCNPTHKTQTGTANGWGTTNSKPPGPIIYAAPMRNTELQLDHIYYTTFLGAKHCALHQPRATCTIMLRQNHFPEPNRHVLDFLHLISLCRVTYRALLEMLLELFLRCQRIWFTIVGEWGMNEFFWLQQIMGTFHGSISLNCHSFMMRWYFTWSQSHMYIVSAMHVRLHAMHISLHSLNAKWFHFKYVYVKFGWNENQRNLNMQMELFFPCVLLPWSFCFFKFLK